MSKVISEIEKIDENEEPKELSLKEIQHVALSMNTLIAHYNLKFRISREGIINCLKKIHIETEELSKLQKKDSILKEELKELRIYIRNVGKHNKMLDMVLNREKCRSQLFDTHIIILRRNKNKMLKLQEIAREEINFMNNATDKMKDKKNESLKKYYKAVVNKHKLKDESKKLKTEMISLKGDLQNCSDYKVLKDQIQDIAVNMK